MRTGSITEALIRSISSASISLHTPTFCRHIPLYCVTVLHNTHRLL